MDVRVRYTKQVISEAFFGLLRETPVSEITVKAICEKAQINRTTFYKYYDNPYDLMNKLENELLDALQIKLRALNDAALQNVFTVILEDICAKRELYLTLFSVNGDALFRERVFEICLDENLRAIKQLFPGLAEEKQKLLYYFIAEGCNGVLGKWIEGGMVQKPRELIGFVTGIISAINRASFPAGDSKK